MAESKIKQLYLYPPLAFARVGSGDKPVDAYLWGPNDDSPRGTGKTTIVPVETLDMDDDGNVTSRIPNQIEFKQVVEVRGKGKREVFRPVCPWFELHGEWEIGGITGKGPITEEVLTACGKTLSDVRWSVEVANRKAYNMSLSRGDIVFAHVPDKGDPDNRPSDPLPESLAGNDTTPQELKGRSETHGDDEKRLVLENKHIPLGKIQLSKPNAKLPGLRLRFRPPSGALYGPEKLSSPPESWEGIEFANEPEKYLILNDNARWSEWGLEQAGGRLQGDARTVPFGQFAHIRTPIDNDRTLLRSIGVIDDFSDGIITCRIGEPEEDDSVAAQARIVVGPPDYAPDRRHPVSLADVLKDRADKRDVAAVYKDVPTEEISKEIEDLFQRIWETVGLVNIDGQNQARQVRPFGKTPFDLSAFTPEIDGEILPLTAQARRMHRRLGSTEVLEDVFRERQGRVQTATKPNEPPRQLDRLLNQPPQPDGTVGQDEGGRPNSFSKMPALMRGSDIRPLHLTRWQHKVLTVWIDRLSKRRREKV